MPNWCHNSLIITGDKEALKDIYEIALSCTNIGFFNQVVPRPNSEEENWYHWNIKNWGTKWDVGIDGFDDFIVELSTDKEDGIDRLHISVGTAWSPPVPFVITLCAKLKVSAVLNYIEPGFDFVGTLVVENEKVILDDYRKITKESLKHFGYDQDYIDDFF